MSATRPSLYTRIARLVIPFSMLVLFVRRPLPQPRLKLIEIVAPGFLIMGWILATAVVLSLTGLLKRD